MDKLEIFKKEKREAEKYLKIGIPITIIGVLSIFLLGEYLMIGVFILLVGFLLNGVGGSKFSKLNNKFKNTVLVELVSSFVDNGKFVPSMGLSMNQVYSTEFLKRADRSHTEDYLSGSIEGVEFVSSDVKLEERHVQHTKNGTRTYYETYFFGRIFIFEFNKRFDGYLQVLENGRPVSNRRYSKIKMESVAFNKKFRTYTTNDHSAFYVITPHFMEALMKFEQYNRGSISFSFIDGQLYIGINNNKDTFELRMFKPINDELFDEFKNDLLVIKQVIHELKLNNKIFK